MSAYNDILTKIRDNGYRYSHLEFRPTRDIVLEGHMGDSSGTLTTHCVLLVTFRPDGFSVTRYYC